MIDAVQQNIDSVPFGIIIVNSSGTLVRSNLMAASFGNEGLLILTKQAHFVCSSGATTPVQLRVPTGGGQGSRWVEVHGKTSTSESGEKLNVLMFFDVTKTRQELQSLKSAETLRAELEAMTQSGTFSLDEKKNFSASHGFLAMFGKHKLWNPSKPPLEAFLEVLEPESAELFEVKMFRLGDLVTTETLILKTRPPSVGAWTCKIIHGNQSLGIVVRSRTQA